MYIFEIKPTVSLYNFQFKATTKQKPVFDIPLKNIVNHKKYGDNLGAQVPCINSTAAHGWLNRADVRQALHIKAGLPDWDICRWVYDRHQGLK